jgi:predicted NBD/HSP70 family sugar kinase
MILGSNSKLSKKINRELVLKTIYNNKPISRADIARITCLTPASITKIIDEFLKIGLVVEKGNDFSGIGRKPIMLDINKDKFYVIGLYVARKSISGIVTNLNAEIKLKIQDKKSYLNQKNLIDKVVELVNKLIENSKIDKSSILGIGMAVPGPINAKKGEIIDKGLKAEPPYNWKRLPLVEKVSEATGLPVFADNCSNVSAIGESWFGNGIKYNNFILISFGEGVGGGLVLKSRLYRGEDDIVGEIGHNTIDINGPQCECGNYGCLELYIKNSSIMDLYEKLILKYPESDLSKKKVKNVEDIYNFKNKDDLIYKEIIGHLTDYLGIGIVNFVNILNPEAIIISTNELEFIEMDAIINKLTEIVRNRAYPVIKNKVDIVPSKLKNNVQLIGAIGLVLRDFFELRNSNKNSLVIN